MSLHFDLGGNFLQKNKNFDFLRKKKICFNTKGNVCVGICTEGDFLLVFMQKNYNKKNCVDKKS